MRERKEKREPGLYVGISSFYFNTLLFGTKFPLNLFSAMSTGNDFFSGWKIFFVSVSPRTC